MNIRRKSFILQLVLMGCFIISATSIKAQKLYQTSWKQEAFIYGSSVGFLLGGIYLDSRYDPITEYNLSLLNSSNLPEIDRSAIDQFSTSAGTQSDYLKNGISLIPFTLFLSKQGREHTNELLIMYTEVLALNNAVTLFTKNAVGRYRPYAYNPDVSLDLKFTETTRRSFFSGHVSQVSSVSFFTAKVFNDLYPESNFRYLVWAGAAAVPAITGYLRVKAGRHFPTDVIVGYGVGAVIGYFIPHLHKITKDSSIDIIGAEGGLGMTYTF